MGRGMGSLVLLLLMVATLATSAVNAADPLVIVVGAGLSGISAAKTLSEAGINDILILEASNHIGGRIHKERFAGLNVEVGANWIEGVNGDKVNPIWSMGKKLKLRNFYSDFSNISSNAYQLQKDGSYKPVDATKAVENADIVYEAAQNFSKTFPPSGSEDISILTYQRIRNSVPSTALEMAIDYFNYDSEFAEPPRLTSLQNTQPLPTFTDFGEDNYLIADERGYETIVYDLAKQFLSTDRSGKIIDRRLLLNKVVRQIRYTNKGVIVKTEDGASYATAYAMVSPSIGVLQSNLIKFTPDLPTWKIMAIYQFDMAIYTKIYLKFPSSFWPTGKGSNFFIYANERRGYYTVWQSFEQEYPGANVLLVTVTDEESRRIEQQSDEETKAEAMEVLRDMFGNHIPNATDILVPRWWRNRFYKGSFSNWPLGVNRYEYDQIRAPVGRVYFTGEHTSENYNGYVHGAYFAGIDSASMLIACVRKGLCDVKISPKTSI